MVEDSAVDHQVEAVADAADEAEDHLQVEEVDGEEDGKTIYGKESELYVVMIIMLIISVKSKIYVCQRRRSWRWKRRG